MHLNTPLFTPLPPKRILLTDFAIRILLVILTILKAVCNITQYN
jgi:hypothetical protein